MSPQCILELGFEPRSYRSEAVLPNNMMWVTWHNLKFFCSHTGKSKKKQVKFLLIFCLNQYIQTAPFWHKSNSNITKEFLHYFHCSLPNSACVLHLQQILIWTNHIRVLNNHMQLTATILEGTVLEYVLSRFRHSASQGL